jgi:fructose-bisphosphate aldolase class II
LFGTRPLAAVIESLRKESKLPIFLNADPTHSLASAVEAAKAGFDSVVIDFSAQAFDENVRRTREVVDAIKAINPSIVAEIKGCYWLDMRGMRVLQLASNR